MARRNRTPTPVRSQTVRTADQPHEVELTVLADVEHEGWHFMLCEDGTIAIQPQDLRTHAISASEWQQIVGATSVMTQSEVEPQSDLSKALKWALGLLMRPQDQHDFCNQHGKVPITHACVYHSNEHFAHASATLKEVSA